MRFFGSLLVFSERVVMDWKELEAHVRDLASYHWAAKANPESINGVRFDCVIKKRSDY